MTDEFDDYVVIRFNEDGDPPSPKQMSSHDLRNALLQNYWGPHPAFAKGDEDFSTFVGLLIVKGQIVQPQAHERVVSWWLP